MSDPLNLGSINWMATSDTIFLWVALGVIVLLFFVLIWWLMVQMSYNIYVEEIRQVGEPFYEDVKDEDGKVIGQSLKINYESRPRAGKLYEKRARGGGSKEYFKVRGTSWDYQNSFSNNAFYFRRRSGFLDFKTRGVKLFLHPDKGYVPLLLSEPGFEASGVTLNEVIGSISDSLHERDQLYGQGFWEKYGTLLTLTFLMGFFVVGMIFMIKYQEVFWQNSMAALQSTIKAVKEVAAPPLT